MDFDLFRSINGLAIRSDLFEDLARVVAMDAQYFFVAILLVLFLAGGRWASVKARRGVVAAGAATLLAMGLAQVISHLWERARPFVAHPDVAHLYITGSPDPSFPSDHATAAFAIAVSIFLRNRRAGYVALAAAFLLAIARVAVGTHYPGDVAAGAALGTLAALFFWIPVIRRPLDYLADWFGARYDSALAWGRAAVA